MNIFKIFNSFLLGVLGGSFLTHLCIWLYFKHQVFASALLAQIIGGGIVASCSYYYLLKHETLFSKPKLKFLVKQNKKYSDVIFAIENADDYELSFTFAIKNSGNKTLLEKRGYWHIYISEENFTYESTNLTLLLTDNNHLVDILNDPIFPNSIYSSNFLVKINYEKNLKDIIKIYAYMSTEFGRYPKSAKDNSDGTIAYANMQEISVIYKN